MDYAALTTPPPVDTAGDVVAAYRRLADLEAIRNLVALYSIARDDNDLDRLVDFFAPAGSFVVGDARHTGHAELRTFYAGNMVRYRTSLHVTHSHVIDLRGSKALGLVTGHAELAMSAGLIVAAYRYDDEYVNVAGRWLFHERVLRFMYAMPPDELRDGFHDENRMRWPELEPAPADIPESLPTYRDSRARIDSGDW